MFYNTNINLFKPFIKKDRLSLSLITLHVRKLIRIYIRYGHKKDPINFIITMTILRSLKSNKITNIFIPVKSR